MRTRRGQLWQKHMEVHLVLYPVQGIQSPKDKGISKLVWRMRPYQQPDVDSWLQKKKTGKQFLDFIKRVDQKYGSNIKQVFLVLDNVSIHKSNKVKETIVKYHPRIHPAFLPTRSPELNLIEVRRWLWMHRQAINNSTFQNEQDIGKAVSGWTCNYNKKHTGKTSMNSLHEDVSMCLHNC